MLPDWVYFDPVVVSASSLTLYTLHFIRQKKDLLAPLHIFDNELIIFARTGNIAVPKKKKMKTV